MIYDDSEHIRLNTLPGMWERTITIGSAGKTFSVTGWKTGWAYGPADLMNNLQMVHQYCVDSCPSLIQVRLLPSTNFNRPHKNELFLGSHRYSSWNWNKSLGLARVLFPIITGWAESKTKLHGWVSEIYWNETGYAARWILYGSRLVWLRYLSNHKLYQTNLKILIEQTFREQNWSEQWTRSRKRLSFHKMDDKKCWYTGDSAVCILQWRA